MPGERWSLERRSGNRRGLSLEAEPGVYSAQSVDAEFFSETHRQ